MGDHGGIAAERRGDAPASAPRCAWRSRCARRGRHGLLVALLAATQAGAALGAPDELRVALPCIPPPHVRFPDGFDEQGCALIAHGGAPAQRVCPATRTATSPPKPGATAAWARYLGYEGPAAAATVRGSGVVLLPDTLTVTSTGWWRAAGLVRNDTTSVARQVRVSVTLATSGDRPLGHATVVVPVRNVRPGEPAPFELRTLVPVQAVRRVAWSVTVESGGTSSPSRMAEIEVGRIAPHPSLESRRAHALLLPDAGAEAADGAQIGWGILRNWGPITISSVAVVGMWIDERGRAIRMVEGRTSPGAGSAALAADLLPGGTRSFELFERDPNMPHGAGWRLAIWQSTS